MENEKIWIGIAVLVIVGLFANFLAMPFGLFYPIGMAGMGTHNYMNADAHEHMGMDDQRIHFIDHKNSMQEDMRMNHDYRCCLESPCTYCIEKDPKHGEGASCDCLSDIVNGVHPCGECIGEILEGHGIPYLAEYFAQAIAEEVGEQHKATLKEIISEKYDISIEEQV